MIDSRASMKNALKTYIGKVALSGEDFTQAGVGLGWVLDWESFEDFKKDSPYVPKDNV